MRSVCGCIVSAPEPERRDFYTQDEFDNRHGKWSDKWATEVEQHEKTCVKFARLERVGLKSFEMITFQSKCHTHFAQRMGPGPMLFEDNLNYCE